MGNNPLFISAKLFIRFHGTYDFNALNRCSFFLT